MESEFKYREGDTIYVIGPPQPYQDDFRTANWVYYMDRFVGDMFVIRRLDRARWSATTAVIGPEARTSGREYFLDSSWIVRICK